MKAAKAQFTYLATCPRRGETYSLRLRCRGLRPDKRANAYQIQRQVQNATDTPASERLSLSTLSQPLPTRLYAVASARPGLCYRANINAGAFWLVSPRPRGNRRLWKDSRMCSYTRQRAYQRRRISQYGMPFSSAAVRVAQRRKIVVLVNAAPDGIGASPAHHSTSNVGNKMLNNMRISKPPPDLRSGIPQIVSTDKCTDTPCRQISRTFGRSIRRRCTR